MTDSNDWRRDVGARLAALAGNDVVTRPALPPLGKLDGVQLPSTPVEQLPPVVPEQKLPAVINDVQLADILKDGAKLSIEQCIEILEMQLPDPADESFGAVLRAKNSAAQTLINAQMRVDENTLRQERFNALPDLLRIIADEEKKLPALLLEKTL